MKGRFCWSCGDLNLFTGSDFGLCFPHEHRQEVSEMQMIRSRRCVAFKVTVMLLVVMTDVRGNVPDDNLSKY